MMVRASARECAPSRWLIRGSGSVPQQSFCCFERPSSDGNTVNSQNVHSPTCLLDTNRVDRALLALGPNQASFSAPYVGNDLGKLPWSEDDTVSQKQLPMEMPVRLTNAFAVPI